MSPCLVPSSWNVLPSCFCGGPVPSVSLRNPKCLRQHTSAEGQTALNTLVPRVRDLGNVTLGMSPKVCFPHADTLPRACLAASRLPWRNLMIQLTRLNNKPLAVNSDLIKFVEQAPDTVITLISVE